MRDSKLASTLSVFVIVFSTAAIYYSLRGGPSPSINTAPHEAAGWVLGQQTLSLLEPGGRILVIARDTTAFQNPASDVLLAGFKKALSKKDQKIDSISLIQADPLRPAEVPSGDFYELMRNTPKGSVIVSLLGPPMLTDSQRARLNQVNPGVVAFCSGSIPEMLDLRVLFEKKLLQVAIISRRQPQQSSRSTGLQGWFDRFFVCVTPSNLNALSAGATPPLSKMHTNRHRRREQLVCMKHLGFTLTDLLVSLAVLSILLAIVTNRLVKTRESSKLVHCTTNLKQVNQAVLSFCVDNAQTLPTVVPGDNRSLWWWYKEQVKKYTGSATVASSNDLVFTCPSDRGYSDGIPFRLNPRFDFGSFVYNGVTLPGVPSIAGLRLSEIRQPRRTLLVMEWTAHAPLSWHFSKTGKRNMPFYCDAQSVVGFVDGHVNFSKIYYDGYNAAYTQDPIPGYDYQYSGN